MLKEIKINDRVFFGGIGAILLVAFATSITACCLMLLSIRDLKQAEAKAALLEENRQLCREALIRSDAKLEQMQNLVEMAAERPGRNISKGMGGP
jgi:hypothetical protein